MFRPRLEDNNKIGVKLVVKSEIDLSALGWKLVVSSCAYGGFMPHKTERLLGHNLSHGLL
jgi:hypothetical protein